MKFEVMKLPSSFSPTGVIPRSDHRGRNLHRSVGKKLLVVLVSSFAASLAVSAANHYVTPSGSGSKSGADWNNAMASIPATQVRGDTYVLAGGAYPGYQLFSTPVSGTQVITFRHASKTLDSAVVGWADNLTNQSSWTDPSGPCWVIATGYLVFNGNQWSGPEANTNGWQYGFKLSSQQTPASEAGCITVYNGASASNITLTGIEIQAGGTDTDGNHRGDGIYINAAWGYADSWTIQDCYIHDCFTWIQLGLSSNSFVDHCYFRYAGSNSNDHGDGLTVEGANVTIRYCILENMIGASSVTYIKPDGGGGSVAPNMAVYGNCFRGTDPNEFTTQWANLSATGNNYTTGLKFYNNSSYGLHGPIGVSVNAAGNRVPVVGGNNVVENNLWLNCPKSDGVGDLNIVDHNATSGILGGPSFGDVSWSGQFVDAANGDFHLLTDTVSGDTLPSPFNIDPNGNSRIPGTWSLGAYQYTGGSSGATPAGTSSPQISITGNGSFGTVTVGQSSTLNLTVQNAGGGTLTGNASTAAPFSVISGGSFSVASGGSQTVTLQFSPTVAGPSSQVLSFNVSNAGISGSSISLSGQGASSTSVSSPGGGLSFSAASGVISAPFVVSNGSVSQAITTGITGGGRAVYTFTTSNAGNYVVQAGINAPSLIENSFYLNIDADPLDETMAWDILPPTSGFETRLVSWRGAGTPDNDLISPKVFTLSQGQHQLVVLGREANTQLSSISLIQLPPAPSNLRIVASQ